MEIETAWSYGSTALDPRSIQDLGDGAALVTSRDGEAILTVRESGKSTTFSGDDYRALFSLPPTSSPGFFCSELNDDRLLVVSRGEHRVFEAERVGSAWRLNWVYGDGVAGYEPNQIFDPFYATYARNGDVLIADDWGHRVMQVRTSDYDADALANGFTEESIVWQFGTPGVDGYTGQLLTQPRSLEEMSDGTMVITDTGFRIIRVRKTGPRTGTVIWTYGTPGVQGTDVGQLHDPNRARVLDNGNILVCDLTSRTTGRVLEIDPGISDPVEATVWSYSTDTPGSQLVGPRDAVRTVDGLTLIADSADNQVLAVGYPTFTRVTSGSLDCGLPGVRKVFSSLSWLGTTPPKTAVKLELSVDGGNNWVHAGPANPWIAPAPVYGELIRYRVALTTTDRSVTPLVEGVTIESEAAPVSPETGDSGDGGDGDGDGGNPRSSPGGQRARRSGSPGNAADSYGTGTASVLKGSGNQSGRGVPSGAAKVPAAVSDDSQVLTGIAFAGSTEDVGTGSAGAAGTGGGTRPTGALLLIGGLYGTGLARGSFAVRRLARYVPSGGKVR